jgi:sulfatase modifying factor 1
MRVAVLGLMIALATIAHAEAGAPPAPATSTGEHASIGAVQFVSVLPRGPAGTPIELSRFALDRRPVTNADFLAFVTANPRWRRGHVTPLFADERYLAHWEAPLKLGAAALPLQPVTNVSWFAAKAYCEARGEQLPTWYQWEYAAAANEQVADARTDAAWRQSILEWYAQPAGKSLPTVARSTPNVHGVYDLHGLVWEWVLDYNALLVSNDSREQGGADLLQFCGEGALSTADRDNYAILMRVAFLSSLEARYSVSSLGFRCAADAP